jgi:L-2,4-diaminobutyrate decarboxylase
VTAAPPTKRSGVICPYGSPDSLGHLGATLWDASLNQNLLHPTTAPVARDVEERVVAWLASFFGMTGGHMTPGSTLANLTTLWAGVQEAVASASAHLSVA